MQRHSFHTFSAFWLWSSVVSVLISVTTDKSPTGDLLVTLIFIWGGVLSSLLMGPSREALAWHKAGGCTPFGVTNSVVYLSIWNQGCVRLANCQPRGKFENTATHSMKMPAGKNMYASLSTVPAQDHFYSDFLSLSLTILTHKGSMRMIIIRCGVESAVAFVTGGMNYSTVDYLNGSYFCNKLELICSSVP